MTTTVKSTALDRVKAALEAEDWTVRDVTEEAMVAADGSWDDSRKYFAPYPHGTAKQRVTSRGTVLHVTSPTPFQAYGNSVMSTYLLFSPSGAYIPPTRRVDYDPQYSIRNLSALMETIKRAGRTGKEARERAERERYQARKAEEERREAIRQQELRSQEYAERYARDALAREIIGAEVTEVGVTKTISPASVDAVLKAAWIVIEAQQKIQQLQK